MDKSRDRCAPSSESLPNGAVPGDPPGWRLIFRVVDAVRDNPKHFARIAAMIGLVAGSLVVSAFVVGPWVAGGIGAAVAAVKNAEILLRRAPRSTRR